MNRLLLSCCVLALAAAFSAGTSAQGDPHRPSLSRNATSLFASSDNCIACHNGLRTASGDDVSIGTAWRSTMMANSARDPYFQAGLRRETMEHPTRAAAIEHECAGCHAPLRQRAAHPDKRETDLLHPLAVPDSDGAGHRLAIDGVSCAVCHQISGEGLGTRETANGRFLMAPLGSPRVAFGPFAVNAGRARIMSSVTGFTQTEAPHVQQSALCATCHTLYTEALDSTGKVIGELPEQMTYAEWEHSAFYTEKRSCQSCHMPEVQERTRVASVLGEEREFTARLTSGKVGKTSRLMVVVGGRDIDDDPYMAEAFANRMNLLSGYGLRTRFRRYDGEGHMTVPARAVTDTLRFVFESH